MQVKILSISRSSKPSVLASVRIELTVEGTSSDENELPSLRQVQQAGDTITIDDARVLRNKHGQLWLAMPSYSIPSSNGRSYDYLPAVVLSTKLKREVDDAVLPAFEVWEQQQGATPAQGGGR